MRIFFLLFFLFQIIFNEFLCADTKVIVSVAPTKYLVEKIGAEYINCVLFVPPGTSPHSYEPSLRQVVENSNAHVWFRIGENFENRIVKLLNDKMLIVDLRENLSLISSRCHCHEIDTHIWLSPKLLKIQAETICSSLSKIEPEHAPRFQENTIKLIRELTCLDEELENILKISSRKVFLVSHPAFGYFCKDYQLQELSIEIEGKEPTPRQITCLLEEAKEKNVDLVITQPQYSNRGAHHLAKELHAKEISVDPYEENVVDNLRFLAKAIAQ